MNYLIKTVSELAVKAGFDVWLSSKGNYGFMGAKDGLVTCSFAVRLGELTFTGSYISVNPKQCGQGWRIDKEFPLTVPGIKSIMQAAQNPPSWAHSGCSYRLKTVDEHLKMYGKTSNYYKFEGFHGKLESQ